MKPFKEGGGNNKQGGEHEPSIETLLARSRIPETYWNFVRGLTDLPRADRKSRIDEMAGINADFAETEMKNSIQSFLSEYEREFPRREMPQSEQSAPDKIMSEAPRENINVQSSGESAIHEEEPDRAEVQPVSGELATDEVISDNAETPAQAVPDARSREKSPNEQRAEFLMAKYERWASLFRKVDISERLMNEVVKGTFSEDAIFQNVDELVSLLEDNKELPLKKYRLFVHQYEEATLVDKNDNIQLSVPDLIKNGPNATAESLVEKIRKQEKIVVPEVVPSVPVTGEKPLENSEVEKPQPAVETELTEPTEPTETHEPEKNEAQQESPVTEDSEDRSYPLEGLRRFALLEEQPEWRERVAKTASRLAERFGVKDLVDSVKMAYSGGLADWHTSQAVDLKGKLEDRRSKIHGLEEDRYHLEDQIRKFREEGEMSESALMRIEKDRAETEKKIESNKNVADQLQSSLEYRNNQRSRYENRRNEVCRGYMGRVTERLNPFEERLADLKSTQGQLNEEISHHQKLLGIHEGKIAKIKALVDAEKFSSVRRAYREIIRRAENEAKDIEREISAREKDRGRIDKRIMKQDKKANPLRDKLNELARITQRTGADTSVTPREKLERESRETREVSGRPRRRNDEDTGEEDDDDLEGAPLGGGGLPRKPRPEFEKKYSGEELVETWNKANGSRMRINLEKAKKNFPTFFEEERMSVDDFWRFNEFYAERYGDEERFEGMPSVQKAARKRKKPGFWARLFGRGRAKSERNFLDFLGKK